MCTLGVAFVQDRQAYRSIGYEGHKQSPRRKDQALTGLSQTRERGDERICQAKNAIRPRYGEPQ